MKIERVVWAAVLAVASAGGGAAFSQSGETGGATKAFLGRWDLTLKAPDREFPSWIEIKENDGKVSADFVSRSGNARPLPKIEIKGNHILFVSPKEEEARKQDMVFEGSLAGQALSGTTTGQDGTPWTWTGVRAPSLKRTGAPKWGKPVKLFDGSDLAGWRMMPADGKPAWTVENGELVTPGSGPELATEKKWQDFKLHIEYNCGKDSNSGVYLRGRYEVQIETETKGELPSQHTGGVYGFLAPTPEHQCTPGAWEMYDITLIGRRVTVVQNGTTVIDDKEIPGITGGAVDSHEGEPGPIYLQGSESGHVRFRNIVITPAE